MVKIYVIMGRVWSIYIFVRKDGQGVVKICNM